MEIKEKIKNEIDQLSDDLLYQVEQYLIRIKKGSTSTRINRTLRLKRKYRNGAQGLDALHPIKTLHLKGQYDNVNLRQKAYE